MSTAQAITEITIVRVIEDTDTREAIWTGTLADFVASNEFTEAEEAEIRAALAEDGCAAVGGGAAQAFLIEVVHGDLNVIPEGRG